MTNADKKLEKLGYHIASDDETITCYDNDTGKQINFYKEIRGVAKVDWAEVVSSLYSLRPKLKTATPGIISMQELGTINEKCKELGWLDDKC